MKKYGKLLLTILGITVIWFGIYIFLVPIALTSSFAQKFTSDIIYKHTGLNLKLENYSVKTSFTPNIKIKTSKILLTAENDDIEAEDVILKINLFKSLFGNISISKLYIASLKIDLNKDYTHLIKIPETVKLIKHLNLKNVNVISADIALKNQVLIDDFILQSSGLQIKNFKPSKRISFITDAKLTQGEREGKIEVDADILLPISVKNIQKNSITADIQNIDLHLFERITNLFSKNIEELRGIVDLNIAKDGENYADAELFSDGFKLKFKDNNAPIMHSEPITIKTTTSFNGNYIHINKLKISSKLINASLYGKIDTSDISNPDLALTFSMDKSDIKELTKLLPPMKDLIPELNLYALKVNDCGGNALAHLEITGEALTPEIRGNVLVSDVWLGKIVNNAKKATIKLIFLGEKMSLDVHVPTAPSEYVDAKGIFDLYNEKRCTLNVKSTKNINLETAQAIINPLQQLIKIDFGPIPIMKILGIGNIDIDISGNKIDPHITGVFNFRNGQVSFIDMPELVVKNTDGTLSFNDTDTYFKTNNAEVNSKQIFIDGNCTLLGKFNYNVKSTFQNLGLLVENMKSNTLLGEINDYLEQLEYIKGHGDINLKIYGEVKNIQDAVFNKNMFASGDINLQAVTFKLKNIPQAISNVFGKLSVNNTNLNLNLYALLNASKIYIDGYIKNNNANITVKSNNFKLLDGLFTLPNDIQRIVAGALNSEDYLRIITSLNTDFKAQYTGSINPVNLSKVNLQGVIHSVGNNFKQVEYSLANSVLKYSPLEINTPYLKLRTQGVMTDMLGKNPMFNGFLNLDNLDISAINFPLLSQIEITKPYIGAIERAEGSISFKSSVRNNVINASTNLQRLKLHEKYQTHEILSGKLHTGGGKLKLENINARLYEMPILLNGEMFFNKNILSNYNLKLKTKPNQDFLNTCFNKYALYPIKLKGETSLDANITGNTTQTNVKSVLTLAKDASLYYMGATIGDNLNSVRLTSDMTLKHNLVKLNDFNYDKVVLSLDNQENRIPLLNINGTIDYTNINAVKFDDLKIKSYMPVDAKIFNIIFGKPFMKEGFFTSDLIMNGTSIAPYIIGQMNISSVNIPLIDANINDINLDFSPRQITVNSSGNLVSNHVKIFANLKNNLKFPIKVDNLDVHLSHLDINKIIAKIKDIEEAQFKLTANSGEIETKNQNTTQTFDFSNLIINNSNISADTILIDNITATNFKSNISLGNDNILNVKDFDFTMAEGSVNGNLTHNYTNNDVNFILNLYKANAAQLAETLFNLKGQIKGLANGKIALSCNAQSEKSCLATLRGNGNFEIQDGAIPKLGSLEYLLKAGNLISNGITGLTINGIIDLLSPLKSGEFKTISGDFTVNNGVADNVNIYSAGRDLNIYITGKYDIPSSVADFQIFGSLSKNITSVVNKVKNLSLNTLLKTIPGISREIDSQFNSDIARIPNSGDINSIYKFFRAVIQGDINGSGFVKSFEWLE